MGPGAIGRIGGYQNNYPIQKVSKMFISLVDPYFWRSRIGGSPDLSKISSKLVSKYIFTRFSRININLIGSRVGVHQGSRFHAFRIRKEMVGARFSDFIRTYKLSPKIGSKKKNSYFSGRSKKKVSSIRK
jgi:ribosomal protein S19